MCVVCVYVCIYVCMGRSRIGNFEVVNKKSFEAYHRVLLKRGQQYACSYVFIYVCNSCVCKIICTQIWLKRPGLRFARCVIEISTYVCASFIDIEVNESPLTNKEHVER